MKSIGIPAPGALLLALALSPAGRAVAQAPDTTAMRAHGYFLSQDALAGRETASEGERIAAEYVAAQLMRMGLAPLTPPSGEGAGYVLPVHLERVYLRGARLTLTTPGASRPFVHGRDFVFGPTGGPGIRDASGPMLWLGAADSAAARLANAGESRGRWVVLDGLPGAAAATLIPALARDGALGLVALVRDPGLYRRWAEHLGDERLVLPDSAGVPEWQSPVPVLLAGPSLVSALPAPEARPGALLDGELALDAAPRRVATVGHNVAGVVAGTDPEHRDEFVLFTAHLDHLGVEHGARPGTDSIYNGFSDNAAGVSMLLAIADSMARTPARRSVAFVFLTGEERGLLGSSELVAHSPIPLDRIAGVVNLDAGAPPAPPTKWRLAGARDAAIRRLGEAVVRSHGWAVRSDDGSANSDHWPYERLGVPTLFLIPDGGWEGVSEAEAATLRRRWEHYHQPEDEWSVDYPFSGLERYAALAMELGLRLADPGAWRR